MRQTHGMRRLVLYAMAIVVGGILALLAWAVPEGRWAFISLAVGIVAGLLWAARRFPEMKKVHLQGAAVLTLFAGLAIAVLLPSTQTGVECLGASAHACPPAVDQHLYLRIAIALVGAAGAWCLLIASDRRAKRAVFNSV